MQLRPGMHRSVLHGQPSFFSPVPVFRPFRRGVQLSAVQNTRQDNLKAILDFFTLEVGFNASKVERTLLPLNNSRTEHSIDELKDRAQSMLMYLLDMGLPLESVERMWGRCPELVLTQHFTLNDKVKPAMAFLLEELNFSREEVLGIITRFPFVLTYGVKSHLRPQVAFLLSLGVSQEELNGLILSRPQVLGAGIDSVVEYLKRSRGIKRHDIGKLLETWPVDYSLPVVLPADT